MNSGWVVLLPQISLAAGGLVIFCGGAFWRQRPAGFFLYTALLAAALSAISALAPGVAGRDFAGMLQGGGYAAYFNSLFAMITILSLLFSRHYAKSRGFGGDEFYGVMLFAAMGMGLVAGALHWVIFFLGLELLSLSLYLLIAAPRGDAASGEAALKYFIMGSVASAFLTFGIALVYALTGKMNIAQSLAAVDAVNLAGMLAGLGLILVGVAFKISLVPFHLWTPDVYQGAPAPVAAFLSTGSKLALFSALLRFALHSADAIGTNFVPVLWTLAALTMIVGNVTALVQTHLKRLLAYSAIAHMGYLTMALLAVKQGGASAVMFYLAVYALMDLGAFGTVALLSSGQPDLDALDEYRGLGFEHPGKAGLLAVCLFSLAGFPPTAGFIGKFALFQSTLQAGFLILAVIGILTAIVSVYFYLKVIVTLYMRPATAPQDATEPSSAPSWYGDLACAVVLVLLLWLGIMPSSFLAVIARIL